MVMDHVIFNKGDILTKSSYVKIKWGILVLNGFKMDDFKKKNWCVVKLSPQFYNKRK